jgi:hypothetical protein
MVVAVLRGGCKGGNISPAKLAVADSAKIQKNLTYIDTTIRGGHFVFRFEVDSLSKKKDFLKYKICFNGASDSMSLMYTGDMDFPVVGPLTACFGPNKIEYNDKMMLLDSLVFINLSYGGEGILDQVIFAKLDKQGCHFLHKLTEQRTDYIAGSGHVLFPKQRVFVKVIDRTSNALPKFRFFRYCGLDSMEQLDLPESYDNVFESDDFPLRNERKCDTVVRKLYRVLLKELRR